MIQTNLQTLNDTPLARPKVGAGSRAIRVDNVVKDYETITGTKRVLDGICFEVTEGEKIAILGRNGAGKSTLVRLIGGVEEPTQGRIERGLSMSWPIGFSGGFENSMTGLDAIRFISTLYNVDVKEATDRVDDFSELGRYLRMPISTYSSGMRARLAFGLSLTVDFECFLIDEVMAVGDQRFRQKCHDELFVKRGNKAMILISHDIATVQEYCQKALVLKRGRGRVFEDLDLAHLIYQSL